jgi:hypothetical protein
MATKQPTIQNINSALKNVGYNEKISLKEPFFSLEGKHFYFYIPKSQGSIDTRRNFLSKLSKQLNEKKVGLVSFYDEKRSTSPKSSIGKITFVGGSTSIVCKYYESSTQASKEEGNISLKPSNIVPSIIGQWLTPEIIVQNVKTYVKKENAPKPLIDQINLLLDNSLNTKTSIFIDGEVSDVMVPAEFFEILTAIKMAVLLRNNDEKLKEILKFKDNQSGINYRFSKASPLKINIPENPNYPLTDYEVSFKPNNYKETIKVSVKSKVKSENTNTLKLNQIFDSVKDVGIWFRSLSSSIKKEQYAQAQVAYAHLRYSTQSSKGSKGKPATKKSAAVPAKSAEKYAGKVKVGFPIDAVGHILQIPYLGLERVIMQRSKFMDGKVKRTPTAKEVKMLAIVCRKVARVISKTDTRSNLDVVLTKKSESQMLSVINNLISSNNMVAGKPAAPDLINLGKYCEKILEWASKDSSPTRLYNFYEMFHTKVLEEKAICYAISDSKRHKTGNGVKTEIIFKYETMVNWDKMWIGLRKKDGDALGLDL